MLKRQRAGFECSQWDGYTKPTDSTRCWTRARLNPELRDGASFVTQAIRFQPGDTMTLPGLAGELSEARLFSEPTQTWQLVGALFQFGGGILDRVMVHTACRYVTEEHEGAVRACVMAVNAVCDTAPIDDWYATLLVYALRRRYYNSTKLGPDSAFVVAVYQQLQLPFSTGERVDGYPLPLHRYPKLRCGHYVRVTSKRNPRLFVQATPHDLLIADITVWLGVLMSTDSLEEQEAMLMQFCALSSVHQFIAVNYAHVWHLPLQLAVPELLEIWIDEELRRNVF